MKRTFATMSALVAAMMAAGCSSAPELALSNPGPMGNASAPAGEPVLELPTMQCLGAYWIIRGDDNKNARIDVEYRAVVDRASRQGPWRQGPPMFRVRKGDSTQKTHVAELDPPADCWLLAGSIVNLAPDTRYEIRLTLTDPDGGRAQRVLSARTIAEPAVAAGAPRFHVAPGSGGGDGSAANPYRGLEQAQKSARPGDVMLLHAGVYDAFAVTKGGAPGKPIVYCAAGDGQAVIDGGGKANAVVEADGVADVWFEGLAIRGGEHGVLTFNSSRMVIRRCLITGVKCGIYVYSRRVEEADETENNDARNTARDQYPVRSFFIADNVLEGPFQWGKDDNGARTQEWRGIQVTGSGHIICHNRVVRFKDGIDTYPSKHCSAIDIYGNDLIECMDDGIEMDFSERNCRCFGNRLTNVFQGISEQPTYGGPIYIFRNVMYNVKVEPFKLHHNGTPTGRVDWWPSGAIFYHNTVVKKGMPLLVWSGQPVYNCVSRNNLFLGSEGKRAYDCQSPMVDCDYDYDGFGGSSFDAFMKWNDVLYKTLADVHAKAPVYKHARMVSVPTAFAGGLLPPEDVEQPMDPLKVDLRLKAGSDAIDGGCVLKGFNDGFAGKAPDLGAYEYGSAMPHYGPREAVGK